MKGGGRVGGGGQIDPPPHSEETTLKKPSIIRVKKVDYQKSENNSEVLKKVLNVQMHNKNVIKSISTVTVFIVKNLGIKLVTAK